METTDTSSSPIQVQDISPSDTRLCYKPTCGKPLVRRKGEPNANFKKRIHCDKHCSHSNPLLHKAQAVKFEEKRKEEGKLCAHCKKTFYRKAGVPKKVFDTYETCSRECADAERVAKKREEIAKEIKICENPECGKEFTRRTTGKHMEPKKTFAKRRTCGVKCGQRVRLNGNQWTKKGSGGGKPPKKATSLPPVTPPKMDIPPAPTPPKVEWVEVWRPASLGGPFKRKVS